MKVYYLILWLSGSEPREMTFPTMALCTAYRERLDHAAPASRCLARLAA